MAETTLILQILTLVVAAGGPLLAYRYARKLALSNNRQQWLDSFRADVAELVAVGDASKILFGKKGRTSDVASARDLGVQLQSLRARIWLRVRSNDEAHCKLRAAVDAFLEVDAEEDRNRCRQELLNRAEVLIQRAWGKILRGE